MTTDSVKISWILEVKGVKYPALSLQWLQLLLGCGFDPWPGNFHMLWARQKKKKKKKFPLWCNGVGSVLGALAAGLIPGLAQ